MSRRKSCNNVKGYNKVYNNRYKVYKFICKIY